MSAATSDARDGLDVRFVTVDGLPIRTAVRPGRLGPPLVMLTGIGASLEALLPFVDALQEREVVLLDVPGAGASPPPPRPLRFSAVADLVRGLTERLGYGTVDVLGVSWGGGVAQEFARRHGGVCRRLILAATATGAVMVPGDWRAMLELASPRRYGTPGHMARVAPTIYGGALRRDPALAEQCMQRLSGGTVRGYYNQLYATIGWTSVHWLHTLRQPTLILAGGDDPIVPLANARMMAALIPGARLEVIDCGHLFLLTKPDETARTVLDFLG